MENAARHAAATKSSRKQKSLNSPPKKGWALRRRFSLAGLFDGLAVVERAQSRAEDRVAVFFAEGGAALGFARTRQPGAPRARGWTECFTFIH